MKYTLEQRLSIGREIYTHELSVNEAAIKYEINSYTARDYMRFYRTKNGLPLMATNEPDPNSKKQSLKNMNYNNYSDLEFLSKEELIDEIIKARVEAERSKKGYEVKGGGVEKEFISLKNQNLK
jgi:transposase